VSRADKASKAEQRRERDEFVDSVAREKPTLFRARDREKMAQRERKRDEKRRQGS
jgi:hypothetical protein